MELKATVTAIGESAITAEDPLVILFDQDATAALKKVAIIQKFSSLAQMQQVHLTQGDKLLIDDNSYTVEFVGEVVNTNLVTIGHVALIFTPVPNEDRLGNGVYLTPAKKPEFKVGTKIIYQMKAD
ncbi:PTS glucitol/sorbitol transporter subunit IIA [Loigolactobacillus backii]|uniref:PTS sorbitol transporter subunit IIA n=1 Tax=Loigolactobacillus backii TaxID=375175 RepID=A0A192H5B2_9LACO|nr:PTS glucitol/sorbitol transporter subunit IIA [Loigolactobacillus backii]ANK60064.1 PTS sorbitol transporter subunit IIA [Loigolactobacillus backii]ANK63412.1 PTS sorbitol transporter subunit IIA [Loigolactobacillus backii]ANK64947.1 PTS sorbitol transporter subunit IIA [Loigolactobacillus backii]ANK66552.1 PTS sorbitol transporter subunit IIA [Loigolactobacillus backii]ANK69583.1 PTS sorbitol transporter subunit IIA [Loigolactobacillus backii]